MKQRIITGILMAVILLPIVLSSNIYLFSALVAVLGFIASFELARIYDNKLIMFVNMVIILLGIDYAVEGLHYLNVNPLIIIISGFILYSSVTVFKDKKMDYLTHGVFSSIYVGFGLLSIIFIYNYAPLLLWYLLIIAMSNDVFAYFVGVTFGKHKMAPTISPKKSIEGAIGGIVLSTILGALFIHFLTPYSLKIMVPVSLLMAFAGIVGDLLASKIKRDTGIKDFSNVFPGHGGVLDRFDSVIFCSMIFYCFMWLFA